jgi:putative Mn2+ efflux pump MntP
MWEIVLIALGLAVDCFAVSVTGGALVLKPKFKNALKIGGFFGLFQAIMPLIGWGLGYSFKNLISDFDHWVAFGLLAAIGIKMILESFKKEESKNRDILNNYTLFLLAIATSIDSLVVGLGLAFVDFPLVYSVLIIGFFAFILSLTGYFIGHKAGSFLKNRVEIVGGIILIGIGIKIVLEHMLEK